jgi:hypothetical protein
MINMLGYEELLDQSRGYYSSFAWLRCDEGLTLIRTETNRHSSLVNDSFTSA